LAPSRLPIGKPVRPTTPSQTLPSLAVGHRPALTTSGAACRPRLPGCAIRVSLGADSGLSARADAASTSSSSAAAMAASRPATSVLVAQRRRGRPQSGPSTPGCSPAAMDGGSRGVPQVMEAKPLWPAARVAGQGVTRRARPPARGPACQWSSRPRRRGRD
jgi:hypothetical protein